MCPVRFVTYVPGRSQIQQLRAAFLESDCTWFWLRKLRHIGDRPKTKANLFANRPVLAKLPHLSRSRPSGLDAPRRLALLRGLAARLEDCNRLQHRTASQNLPKDWCFSNHRG